VRSADADCGDDAVANGARDGDDERHCDELGVKCALFASGVKVSVLEAAAVTGCLLYVMCV
jgi:hypothetical protein